MSRSDEPFEVSIALGAGGPRNQPCKSGRYYVYVHKNLQGTVFYVGKGTGDRAWSKERGSDWKYYVEHILGGKYDVEIIRDQISEEDAIQVEDALLAEYATTVINLQNLHAAVETEELLSYSDAMRASSRAFNDGTRLEKSGTFDEAARKYEEAYAHYRDATRHPYDRSARQLIPLPVLGPNQIVDRCTKLFVKMGQPHRAVDFAEAYFRDFPGTPENTVVLVIRRRIERLRKNRAL